LGDITGVVILGVIADNTSTEFLMKLWPKYIPIVAGNKSLEVLIMFLPSLVLSTITFLIAIVFFIFQLRKKKEAILNQIVKLSESLIVEPEAVFTKEPPHACGGVPRC